MSTPEPYSNPGYRRERRRRLRVARERRRALAAESVEVPRPAMRVIGRCDTHVGVDAFAEVVVVVGGVPRLMCETCLNRYDLLDALLDEHGEQR